MIDKAKFRAYDFGENAAKETWVMWQCTGCGLKIRAEGPAAAKVPSYCIECARIHWEQYELDELETMMKKLRTVHYADNTLAYQLELVQAEKKNKK